MKGNASRLLSLALLVVCVLLVLHCQRTTSPHLDNYEGDYRLEIAWSSLPDTLLTGIEYSLYCTTATDTFVDYIAALPGNDTVYVSKREIDTVVIEFLQPYSGQLIIAGIRPNQKTVNDTGNVVVVNASVDTVLPLVRFLDSAYVGEIGQALAFAVSDSHSRAVRYSWRFTNSTADTMTTGPTLTRSFAAADSFTAYVHGIDRFNRAGLQDSVPVRVQLFEYRVTSNIPDTIRARHPASFSAIVNDAAKLISGGGRYYWQIISGSDTLDTNGISLAYLTHTLPDSVFTRVSVWVKDTLNRSSSRVQKTIIVRRYSPVLAFAKNRDTVNVDAAIQIKVNAYDTDPSGGGIDSIYYDTNGDGIYDRRGGAGDTAFSLTLVASTAITGYALDKDGFISNIDTTRITVRSERPFFSPHARDTTIYKGTTLVLKVNANPGASGAAVTKYYWKAAGVESFTDTTAKDTLRHIFTTAGDIAIAVVCEDANGLQSAAGDTFVVTVDPGAPRLSAITIDTAATQVFVGDQREYSITATDPNGIVAYLSFNIDGVHESNYTVNGASATHAFTHTFTLDDSGSRTVRIIAVDNDSLRDTVEQVVGVKLGQPRVTSIGLNVPLNSVYILDDLDFTIKGTDENDYIDSVMISWDGDETYEVRRKAAGDSIKYENYQFARADSGVNTIRVMVKDIDGLTRDSTFSVTVLSGAAVIDSITPHSNIWVRDLTNYTIHAHDNNGTVDSFVVDWNNDGIWDLFSNSASMSWTFDTSQYGTRTVKIKIHDDDTVWTEKSMTVDVRLGRPVVSLKNFGSGIGPDSIQVGEGQNGDLDTMFYVYKGGKTYIAVDTADSNGKCSVFYWDFENDGTYNDTTHNPIYGFPARLENEVAVWCTDDDSIQSEKLIFYVYPDEAPPPPTVYAIAPTADSISIYWKNKDVKDGDLTEYRVLVHQGAEPDSTVSGDIVSDWQSGYRIDTTEGYDYFLRFKTLTPSMPKVTYYYQVHARDARVSVNADAGNHTFSY